MTLNLSDEPHSSARALIPAYEALPMTTGVHGLRDKPYKEAVRLQSRPMIKIG